MFWATVSVFIFRRYFTFCKCENRTEIKINILRVLCQGEDRPQPRTSECEVPAGVEKWTAANSKGMATEITLELLTKWNKEKIILK